MNVVPPGPNEPRPVAGSRHVSYIRLGELNEARREYAKAAAYYQKCITLWKDADRSGALPRCGSGSRGWAISRGAETSRIADCILLVANAMGG